MKSKIIGYSMIIAAIGVASGVLYYNSFTRNIPLVYSPRHMLSNIWERYKIEYLETDTYRTLDKQQGNITTSEGQSYTMLRAVWMDDKDIFDKSWLWTKDNLQRTDDHLFAWLFGQRSDGTYGIMYEKNGMNTATDADTDIALSLIFAYYRWKDATYLNDALAIINDVWEKEVTHINGQPYITANNLEKFQEKNYVIVNPSYYAPYAYKIFSEHDPRHDWNAVVETSYAVLEESLLDPLDTSRSAYLPPNWIAINKKSGAISKPDDENLTTYFSYDALRVPWRITIDWKWNNDPRAKRILTQLSFLKKEWNDRKVLYTYRHDGTLWRPDESPAIYGGSIGYFMTSDPRIAEDVYRAKLQFLYSADNMGWKKKLGYYDDNWAWFGMALYHNALPNLSKNKSSGVLGINL